MGKRADKLRFTGKPGGDYFAAVPTRDLAAADIARLTDAQYADITGGDKPLYVAVEPPKPPAKKAARGAAKAPAKASKAAPPKPDEPPAAQPGEPAADAPAGGDAP